MKMQKTYLGQSALQILKDAEIIENENGFSIFSGDLHLLRADSGDLVVYELCATHGEAITLECGPRAVELLDALHDEGERRVVALLKKQDGENGTTYAAHL